MTDFQKPRFGTDGLRGRAGEPPMDPETLRRVGAALGVLLQRRGADQQRVLVGNDGRDSAPWILESLAQGLVAAEIAVADVGLCTTPALAFLTRAEPVAAGIMISASHNPAHDNGIKIFAHDGSKLRDEDEREVETLAEALRPERPGNPRCKDRSELLGRYEQHLGSVFAATDLAGMRLCVDAAHGGGSQLLPRVLRMLGAEVIEVACDPDGFNINDGVGALHPERTVAAVREHRAHLGICVDGDGDRGIFVDETGVVRDGDDQLCLFGLELQRRGDLRGDTVVATVMSNLGLHKALARAGIRVEVTPVGDRNVWLAMKTGGYAVGGEQSGHVLFSGDGHLTGDGLFTALMLLSLPGVRERGFAQAFASFHRFPQKLVNVPVRSKPDLATVPAIAAKAAEIERTLGGDGRLLLRYSGTEPKCRVMIEAAEVAVVERLCSDLAAVVARELG
ncbi:MAG: phosphoglucosamine mutase [Planctomycetes bacterium]|nr:phosphoglucosamine mutase [Planctomycetota bacterium]